MKKYGKSHLIVDSQPIKKFFQRNSLYTIIIIFSVTYHKKSIKLYWMPAMAIIKYYQKKTVFKLPTFKTEGRQYHYLHAPRRDVAFRNVCTRRYFDVILHLPRKHKIVNGALLDDSSSQEGFLHVFRYLPLCGQNDITLNRKILNLPKKEVDFPGYLITWDSYR